MNKMAAEKKILSKLIKLTGLEYGRAFNISRTGICQTDNSFDTISRIILTDESMLKEIKR